MLSTITQSTTCTTTQNNVPSNGAEGHTPPVATNKTSTVVFEGKSHTLSPQQPASTSLLRRLCRVCVGINNLLFCTTISRHKQLLQLQRSLLPNQQSSAAADTSRLWQLTTGTLSLAVYLAIVVNREVHNELASWMSDATNIADHLTQFNQNPIPDYYYTTGDCFRFSSALAGNTHVQPYANLDDIIAIKARFGLITLAYKAMGF